MTSATQELEAELAGLKQRVDQLEKQLAEKQNSQTQTQQTQQDGGSSSGPFAAAAAACLPPAAVPMDATRIVMHQIVAPTEVDALGICTGGQVLSWIDICAGLSAKTLARGPCVTISVDSVHFIRPCRRGDVVIIAAMVNRTFASSMEVGVRVEAEDMRSGLRRHCCSAYLSFVSLQQKQQVQAQQQQAQQQQPAKPPPLPRVVPSSSEHRRIHAQAEARRQQRLAARAAAHADPQRAAAAAACRLKPITHREGCPTLPPALTLTPSLTGAGSGLDAAAAAAQHSASSGTTASGSVARSSSLGSAQPDAAESAAAAAAASAAAPAAAAAGVSRLSLGDGPRKRRVAPSATAAYMTVSVMPQHANTLGITFGGHVMRVMEECAYISASRLRGTHLLTAGMDSVTFAASTKVGDILYVTAQVSAIFGASLEVMISVFAEQPWGGAGGEPSVFHCADAFATLCVVDLQGRPQPIPFQLEPVTPADKLRYQGALCRRAERLAMRGALQRVSSMRPSLDGSTLGGAGGSMQLLPDVAPALPEEQQQQQQQTLRNLQ